MDCSRFEYLVHYNGAWYELRRHRPRPGKRKPIYIWQGTWASAGYKRVTSKMGVKDLTVAK